MPESIGKLYRSRHELPFMSQQLGRAESIGRNFGKTQKGFRISPERAQDVFNGRVPGRGMARPYESLVYTAGAVGFTSDTAFETCEDLTAWMDAYGISFVRDDEPPGVGEYFEPADDSAFQELTARSA
jgi:hypothetical protein